jgi:RNA polymerase sigma-19 factor, ECF subfamily
MSAVLKEQRGIDDFIRYHSTLRRYLRRKMCGRHENDIEDLLQEIGIRYWRRSVEPDIPLAYLHQIANHVMATYLEDNKQRFVLEITDLGGAIEETAGSSMQDIADGIDLGNRVARMLAPVPVTHRAVIILHKMYGYSYQDVARELGLSIHTVEKWVTVGKQMLRSKRK